LIRNIIFLLALGSATQMAAFAQQANAILKGVVTDESGALVPGTRITASSPPHPERVATSGGDGAYALTSLAPGTYTVQAVYAGLKQVQPATVNIRSGTTTLNIALQVASEKQEITVQESTAPLVTTDPAQNADAVVMRGEDLEALSDDPDDLQSDLEALAGPAAGPNGGQIYIDGFTGGDSPLPNKDASEHNFNGTYTFGGGYIPMLNADNMPVVPGIACNANPPAVAGCETISSIEQYRRTLLFQAIGYLPAQIRALGGGATGTTESDATAPAARPVTAAADRAAIRRTEAP
jgi:hypothetical protein